MRTTSRSLPSYGPVEYLDLHPLFLVDGARNDSLYSADGVHLVDVGCETWVNALLDCPAIKQGWA